VAVSGEVDEGRGASNGPEELGAQSSAVRLRASAGHSLVASALRARAAFLSASRNRLDSVAAPVSAAGGEADVAVADLADEASLRLLEKKLAHTDVDLLVNAAGLARFGPLAELDSDQSELQVLTRS
jgi:short-subunit dehydrogenase